MHSIDQTIVAISTAAGAAARAIVRLSGPRAVELADGVFSAADGRPLAELAGFGATGGVIAVDEHAQLPGRAYVFLAPRSYTRQDVVELHAPGSPVVAAGLLDRLAAAGAAVAEPGEFTARAFFSGRIDLSAAEAVADVIAADDDAQLRSAMTMLGGRTHRLCGAAAVELTDVLATVEASIDLAEEDIQLDSPAHLAGQLTALADRLRSVAAGAADVPDAARHIRVVLAGRPNVGKSSLVNALTGADRAIVSALAGTTRDVLSAPLDLDGAAVLLQDAAGFGRLDSDLAAVSDNAARQAVAQADVVCLVLDATDIGAADAALLAELRAVNTAEPVAIANKIDLAVDPASARDAAAATTGLASLATSAVTGEGMADFKRAIAQRLHLTANRGGSGLSLHQRQKRCLLAAADAADAAGGRLAGSRGLADGAELVAIDLREAVGQIGLISGEVVTEDVLGRIFSRFCVGK